MLAQSSTRPRVLIVDDDVDTVQSTALLFNLQGFDADMAFNGCQAVARAQAVSPNLVLLDIAMPEMDGFDVARRLAEISATPPYLVAVTGLAYPADKRRCAEAGFDLHLAKPVDFGVFEQMATAIKTSHHHIKTAKELSALQERNALKFLEMKIDMAHTFLDVAQTTRNAQTRERCVRKAANTQREIAERWLVRASGVPELEAQLAALERHYRQLVGGK